MVASVKKIVPKIIGFLGVVLPFFCKANSLSLSQHDLLRKILKYYEPNVMPELERDSQEQPKTEARLLLDVQARTAIRHVEMDDENLLVQVTVILQWSDKRLEFPLNAQLESKIKIPQEPEFQIWAPEIDFEPEQFESKQKIQLLGKDGALQHSESVSLSCADDSCGSNITITSGKFNVKLEVRKISNDSKLALMGHVSRNGVLDVVLTVYLPSLCLVALIWLTGFVKRRTVRSVLSTMCLLSLLIIWHWSNRYSSGVNLLQLWFLLCFLLHVIAIVESVFCRFPKHKSQPSSTTASDSTSRLERNLSSKESLTYLRNHDSFHNEYHSGNSLLVTASDQGTKTEIFPPNSEENHQDFFVKQQRGVGRRKRRFGFHDFFMIAFPLFSACVCAIYLFCVAAIQK